MPRLLITGLFASLYLAVPAHGSPSAIVAKKPDVACPQTDVGSAVLQDRYRGMWEAFANKVVEAGMGLQEEIDKQTKSATSSGNLDLALFWKGLAKEFEQKGELSWDDSSQRKTWSERFGTASFPGEFAAAVRNTSDSYEMAVQTLAKGYEALVTELTKAERLDDAVKLRDEAKTLLWDRASSGETVSRPKSLRECRSNGRAMASARGGGADTEQSVDKALKWLMLHQQEDGGWSFALGCDCRSTCHPSCKADRAGATGLALLPFLAHGYTDKEGPFKNQVGKAVGFLVGLSNRTQGNLIRDGGTLSSHAYALLALNEFCEMTSRKQLHLPIQVALNALLEADKNGRPGWGAVPTEKPDTLTTASVIACLKRLPSHGGWNWNPQYSVRRAVAFLDQVQYDGGAQYGLFAPEDRPPASTSTAAGLASRLNLGWKRDTPALLKGMSSLVKQGPTDDILYDYYATNVMFAFDGEAWISLNSRMKKSLLERQSRDGHSAGSWFEGFDQSEEAQQMGRLYVTALATLILEVYYRYPSPLQE